MKLNFKYMLPQFLAMLTSLTIWASLMHYSVIKAEWALWRAGIMMFVIESLLLYRVRSKNKVYLGAAFAVMPQTLLLIIISVSSFYLWKIDLRLIDFFNFAFVVGLIFSAIPSLISDPDEKYC